LPAQRNSLALEGILDEVYLHRNKLANGMIPNDPELPLLLDKVYPLHEVVQIDYSIPGCPPSADTIWRVLTDLLAGRVPVLDYNMFHYD